MIVQVYADKSLVYDNRLEGYELLKLTASVKAESGGSATIQIPLTHPAYSKFVSLKTLVEIYRDSELVFRASGASVFLLRKDGKSLGKE